MHTPAGCWAACAAAAERIPGIGPVSEVVKVKGEFQFTEGPASDGHGKLYFTGTVKSEADKNEIWNAIKTIPTWQQDIVADIQVTGAPAAAAARDTRRAQRVRRVFRLPEHSHKPPAFAVVHHLNAGDAPHERLFFISFVSRFVRAENVRDVAELLDAPGNLALARTLPLPPRVGVTPAPVARGMHRQS